MIGEGEAEVTVTVGDRRDVKAKIIGVDSWTDLALLKIDATGLPVIPWGDSSKLRVAEWVMAVGNPFSLNQTVTLGIVSALGRANVGITQYEDFIQTDAAINPGNSGGALINGRGELVGINTAIFSQSGGYQGIGFAVPSNLVRRVVDDLKKFGGVRRGSIGFVDVIPLTARLADELRAPQNRRRRRQPVASRSLPPIAPASSRATSSCRSTARRSPTPRSSSACRRQRDRLHRARRGAARRAPPTIRIPIEAQQERRRAPPVDADLRSRQPEALQPIISLEAFAALALAALAAARDRLARRPPDAPAAARHRRRSIPYRRRLPTRRQGGATRHVRR